MLSEAEVVKEALSLPAPQRAQVAKRLLESLDDEPFDPNAERVWAAEIEARAAAYDRGEVTAIAGDKVIEDARQRLHRRTAP
jgi:putative addiction module component (TIGR02574 family)